MKFTSEAGTWRIQSHEERSILACQVLKLSHSGEQKDQYDESSLVLIPSDGSLGQAHALQKENNFSSVYKYELFNFSTNPRNGKALHCSVFTVKMPNVSIRVWFICILDI